MNLMNQFTHNFYAIVENVDIFPEGKPILLSSYLKKTFASQKVGPKLFKEATLRSRVFVFSVAIVALIFA